MFGEDDLRAVEKYTLQKGNKKMKYVNSNELNDAWNEMRVEKVKTKKGKRILDNRAPKTVENDKTALFIKGSKTNQTVTDAMMDIYILKKPLVQQLKRYSLFIRF
ncbi:hypothetical protein OESDEN_25650 [Oesophagostomum dentatum]|uniref:Uncharacterized protein n=1 Tax=Oesophagostomum dentatum TaxID=61180 RepID=A0A0B1RUL9_OESDE|nr:hypothetical protein OESDEN_25650 [Oesophagostomum dentatum]